jgi:hypothetical protein
LSAREYLKMIAPPPAVEPPRPVAHPTPVFAKIQGKPTHLLPDPELHSEALKPFDESMLK